MLKQQEAVQGSAASDYNDFSYKGSKQKSYSAFNAPLIGRLVLLPATHIKPNQPLVNNQTGEIEIVNKGKFFSSEDYSRYYILTEEVATNKNLTFWTTGAEEGICMYADANVPDKAEQFACYPAANSIVSRLHTMYYNSVKEGKEELLRFAKIHNNKYAGFPISNRNRIPATQAKERWDYIFNHVLQTSPTNLKKKRVGVLFGTIAGADLMKKGTINTLVKYRYWIIS